MAHYVFNGLDQSKAIQILHTGLERPHTRQHDTAGRCDFPNVARHVRLESNVLKAFLNTAKIPHTVVDDRDHDLNHLNGLDVLNSLLLKTSLGRKNSLDAGVQLGRHIHRPGEGLEASLDDVVRILAANHVHVQIHAELIGEGGVKLVR